MGEDSDSVPILRVFPWYYSMYGHVEKLAGEIRKGAASIEGVEAKLWQAFDAGVKLIGATSHFVTEELDSGPIIEQMVESVSHRDNLRSFVQKSEDLEKKCLTKAIKSYCELCVLPYGTNKTVVF